MLGNDGRDIDLQNVAGNQSEVVELAHGIGQQRRQTLVQLDGYDLLGALAQFLGQRTDTGADFQNAGLFINTCALGNVEGNPGFAEEVLAQTLGKRKAVLCQQNFNDVHITKIHKIILLYR